MATTTEETAAPPLPQAAPRVRRGSDLSDKVAMFNKKFQEHHEKQLSNPFSDVERPDGYQATKLDVNDPNYGRYVYSPNWFHIF